nr:MAG TPA_asm: hypothetical protein [Caudoviricetes sp.]
MTRIFYYKYINSFYLSYQCHSIILYFITSTNIANIYKIIGKQKFIINFFLNFLGISAY